MVRKRIILASLFDSMLTGPVEMNWRIFQSVFALPASAGTDHVRVWPTKPTAAQTSVTRWGGSTDPTYLQPIVNNGFKPEISDYYAHWEGTTGHTLADLISAPMAGHLPNVQANYTKWGVIPLWSIAMSVPGGSANSDFAAIAAGTYDNVWQYAVTSIAALGIKTVYLRPGWEMNGSWFSWSVNRGNSTNFIAAWRRIYSVFHAQCAASGVTGKVIYTPSQGADDSLAWPGDAYVDVIGVDGGSLGYNGVATNYPIASSPCSVNVMVARAVQYGKTFALGEWGAVIGEWGTSLGYVYQAFTMNPGVVIDFICLTNWETGVGVSRTGDTRYQNNPANNAAVRTFMQEVAAL
jgi:hypothetical protein